MRLFPVTLLATWPLSATIAVGANSVRIESDSVMTWSDSVSIRVYISNEDSLAGVVLPLEIRSLDSGSYISGHLAITPQVRLNGLSTFTVDTTLPDKNNTTWYKCNGDGFRTRGAPDFVSPEGLFYAGIGLIAPDTTGPLSAVITFGVSHKVGRFVIDTTCVTPDNHLAFFTSGVDRTLIHPTFTFGTVTLTCDCPCYADPECDGFIDILDVTWTMKEAFTFDTQDPDSLQVGCPLRKTDIDGNGVVDVIDVIRIINVAFRNGAPATLFVDPCG